MDKRLDILISNTFTFPKQRNKFAKLYTVGGKFESWKYFAKKGERHREAVWKLADQLLRQNFATSSM